MKRIDLSRPEFGFIVVTRAALGAGIGLLLSNKLRRDRRRSIGLSLVALGALRSLRAWGTLRADGLLELSLDRLLNLIA